MKAIDFPLIAQANAGLKLQKMEPKLPILERKMFYATTIHEFAAAFLARWMLKGKKPTGEPANAFQRSGVALAESVWQSLQTLEIMDAPEPVRRDLRELLEIQQRLTTACYRSGEGSSFLEAPPSDKARREAQEKRNREGSTHRLPRVQRKREKCAVFDARYPQHW